MPAPTQRDLDNAIGAYRDALGRAQAAGNEVLKYLDLAIKTNQTSEDDLFIQAAKRALVAQEEHHKAAALATKVLVEIGQYAPQLRSRS